MIPYSLLKFQTLISLELQESMIGNAVKQEKNKCNILIPKIVGMDQTY